MAKLYLKCIYWFLISVLIIVGIDILNNIFSKEPIIPRKVALQVAGDNRKELEKSTLLL